MELTILDSDDTQPNDEVTAKGDLECVECGTPLSYGGRGRRPKYCSEHKPTPGNSNTTKSPRKNANIDSLVQSIETMYMTVGTGLTMLPVTQNDGMLVANSAGTLAESWRPLLERDPKVRKFWEKTFTVSGYGALMAAHLMVILPIAQAHNLLPTKKVAA